MNRISISQEKLSLFLMSFAFLAWWILLFICMIIWGMHDSDFINLLLLYLFSLFLPAAGLLVFMKYTRTTSSRWYWGIPFLIGILLNTILRDLKYMRPLDIHDEFQFVYGQPFLVTFPIFYKWHILEPLPYGLVGYQLNFTFMNLISISFSVTAALFCLSVRKEKRKKMMLSFWLSLIAVLSNIIFFIAESMRETFVSHSSFSIYNFVSSYSFLIYSIVTIILGLSFVRLAIVYDK